MTKTLTPIDDIRNSINRLEPQLKMALPSHISPQKFIRATMTAIQTTPALVNVERQSLFAEVMRSAQDGLIPNGDEAAIVPFGKQAKYMAMVKGICKKARNSGEISTMDAVVVYENDKYESWIDEKGPHFKHVKARKDRGNPILTYAYAITKDGAFYHEEIDEEQMSAIEKVSRGNNTPWKGPFRDEMKRKSALRRLAKYRLPSSADLEPMFRADDELYDLNQPEDTPEPVEKDVTAPQRLSKILTEDEPKEVVEASADAEPDELADNEVPI
jgi:recombination protein RecT